MTFNLTLLLCDNMLVSSTTLAVEIFKFAQTAALANRDDVKEVKIRWLSPNGKSVKTSAGFELQPTHSIDDVFDSDLVHIPAMWRNPKPVVDQCPSYIPWLQNQHKKNSKFTAVGTGVCFLAEAGLLDDKPATTHWHYFDQFQRRYPKVQLERQRFTTQLSEFLVGLLLDRHSVTFFTRSVIYLNQQALKAKDKESMAMRLWRRHKYGFRII
jgi:transcriptional regulator GlxA family with amidase domain